MLMLSYDRPVAKKLTGHLSMPAFSSEAKAGRNRPLFFVCDLGDCFLPQALGGQFEHPADAFGLFFVYYPRRKLRIARQPTWRRPEGLLRTFIAMNLEGLPQPPGLLIRLVMAPVKRDHAHHERRQIAHRVFVPDLTIVKSNDNQSTIDERHRQSNRRLQALPRDAVKGFNNKMGARNNF